MDSSSDGSKQPGAAPRFEIDVEQRDGETVVTARLDRSAEHCYRVFSDADLIPEWLWVVDTAVVQERDDANRALRVDFIGALERASIGYTLCYEYDDQGREVRWHRAGGGERRLAGSARFADRDGGGCLMEYRLTSELTTGLPPWADQLYRQRPAETVVVEFCEFALREGD